MIQTVPYTTEDVVVMLIKVIGMKNGKLLEKSTSKKYSGKDGMSAIPEVHSILEFVLI